ncbi:MAG: pirin family protein [Comamonas sp.]|jgi:redox-sensitive bicupin YhaK (pirin superfamily)|nr:pirin family protein [Comamonas sp.]
MSASPIIQTLPLGTQWPCLDPFLFCAHHNDAYPAGDGSMGVQAVELEDRPMGSDFSGKDGFNMYHGDHVPGFPGHPHRGFETVTLVRKGLIDHADSLGAAARFGGGDVQWVTAGEGIMHSEMFPLLHTDQPNPLELFQIWLNLPASHKMVKPHFTMLWNERIPRLHHTDEAGKTTTVTVIAGALDSADQPLSPPPESWASQDRADVAIWTISLEPGARWTMPGAKGTETRRMLYWFVGEGLRLEGQDIPEHLALQVESRRALELVNTGNDTVELVLLQGTPIREAVAQYGPFVMNTQDEIRQAMMDFRRTQFGGWPWDSNAPVHGAEPRRFARHPGQSEDEVPTAG